MWVYCQLETVLTCVILKKYLRIDFDVITMINFEYSLPHKEGMFSIRKYTSLRCIEKHLRIYFDVITTVNFEYSLQHKEGMFSIRKYTSLRCIE